MGWVAQSFSCLILVEVVLGLCCVVIGVVTIFKTLKKESGQWGADVAFSTSKPNLVPFFPFSIKDPIFEN